MSEARMTARAATTVEDYKIGLRGAIDEIRADRTDWKVASVNRTLHRLGYPADQLVQAFQVKLPLTATGEYLYTPDSGETSEEAIARLAGWSDRDLMYGLYSGTSTTTESTTTLVRSEPIIVDLCTADDLGEVDPDALTDDLDTYKRLVRRVGIEVAAETSWCDDGLNTWLRQLGLKEKRNIQVPVRALVEQTAMVYVADAEDEEDALRILAANEAQRLELARNSLGATVRTAELPPPATLEAPVVGQPDPGHFRTLNAEHSCGVASRYSDYLCTRSQGHDGDLHVHTDRYSRVVAAIWRGESGTYCTSIGAGVEAVPAARRR